MGEAIGDSRKPWAVLYISLATHEVMVGETDYYWTRWGARRRARMMNDGPRAYWRAKVVRNR